jgi:predicted GIY-YIG superfamily endonuclease
MHYTYVIRSVTDSKWYTGFTGDLRKNRNGQNILKKQTEAFPLC